MHLHHSYRLEIKYSKDLRIDELGISEPKSGKLILFRMSHFPCIRPSLLNKKWIIQETKLNRIEIVRRKEEALLQKFKLISKQGTF